MTNQQSSHHKPQHLLGIRVRVFEQFNHSETGLDVFLKYLDYHRFEQALLFWVIFFLSYLQHFFVLLDYHSLEHLRYLEISPSSEAQACECNCEVKSTYLYI